MQPTVSYSVWKINHFYEIHHHHHHHHHHHLQSQWLTGSGLSQQKKETQGYHYVPNENHSPRFISARRADASGGGGGVRSPPCIPPLSPSSSSSSVFHSISGGQAPKSSKDSSSFPICPSQTGLLPPSYPSPPRDTMDVGNLIPDIL